MYKNADSDFASLGEDGCELSADAKRGAADAANAEIAEGDKANDQNRGSQRDYRRRLPTNIRMDTQMKLMNQFFPSRANSI